MYISEDKAKEMICSIGRKMYMKQFVSANDGNITIRVAENQIIATPTGVSKGDLTPDMLLKVDMDGNILSGYLQPTSEIKMHLRVYHENNDIQSTAHAHPTFLGCFGNLGADLDMPITPATAAISGRIPIVPYCNPGSIELADAVAPYVKDYNVVILANHGPIAWGKTPWEAWYTLEDAEAYAKMAIIQKYIMQSYRPITKEQIRILADTHDLIINPKRLVNAPDETTNTDPGISFDALSLPKVSLDDETIKKLAVELSHLMK